MLLFERQALFLARKAQELEKSEGLTVVAVFFHDADPNSDEKHKNLWEKIAEAMLRGFRQEKYERGVPMVPQPISEVWFLCALKNPPYHNCGVLENLSGKPGAAKNLKKELEDLLGKSPLHDLIHEGRVDPRKIDMPSYNAFRERLEEVLASLS
jgi:hypothetical protein